MSMGAFLSVPIMLWKSMGLVLHLCYNYTQEHQIINNKEND